MAWTAPRTWVDTETVTAALLNTDVRDNMAWLGGFGSGGTTFAATTTPYTTLMKRATGSYTGNGADNRTITGVGFTPIAVFIKAAAAADLCIYFDSMGADHSGKFGEAPTTDRIQAVTSDGFQIGTHSSVNTADVEYFYVCLG